jgi:hypothetical protein
MSDTRPTSALGFPITHPAMEKIYEILHAIRVPYANSLLSESLNVAAVDTNTTHLPNGMVSSHEKYLLANNDDTGRNIWTLYVLYSTVLTTKDDEAPPTIEGTTGEWEALNRENALSMTALLENIDSFFQAYGTAKLQHLVIAELQSAPLANSFELIKQLLIDLDPYCMGWLPQEQIPGMLHVMLGVKDEVLKEEGSLTSVVRLVIRGPSITLA